MPQTDLIIHDEKDNVAVVINDKTSKNQDCIGWIMENDKTVKIKSINEVPLGHKIALQDFIEGDTYHERNTSTTRSISRFTSPASLLLTTPQAYRPIHMQ